MSNEPFIALPRTSCTFPTFCLFSANPQSLTPIPNP